MAIFNRKRLRSYGQTAGRVFAAGAKMYQAYKATGGAKRRKILVTRKGVKTRRRGFGGGVKTKKLHQKAKRDGLGPSTRSNYSEFRRRRSVKSKIMRQTAPMYVHRTFSSSVSSTEGRQKYGADIVFFDQGALNECFTNVVSTNVGSDNTRKLFMHGCRSEMMITNRHNGAINCKIYDVVVRRDFSDFAQNPIQQIKDGLINENATGGDDIVGITPFKSVRFCTGFKVCKVTHVTMPVGGVHTHKVRLDVEKNIQRELDNQFNCMRGLTHFTFFQVYGFPANNLVGSISISPATIDVAGTVVYRYSYLINDSTVMRIGATFAENLALNEIATEVEGALAVAQPTANL